MLDLQTISDRIEIDDLITTYTRAVDSLDWVRFDTVFTEEVMEGTHDGPFAGLPPTGKRVQLPMVHITRVAAGRIIERVAFHDTAGILRQLS